MMSWEKMVELVVTRAKSRCEYCHMLQALQGGTFHVDHIIPTSRGGPTASSNLALACPGCNLRKSVRSKIKDPETGKTVPLFHPRKHRWHEHFRMQDYKVFGQTAIGRATVAFLELNHERRIDIRKAEDLFGLYKP
jgi:hypothetical protein